MFQNQVLCCLLFLSACMSITCMYQLFHEADCRIKHILNSPVICTYSDKFKMIVLTCLTFLIACPASKITNNHNCNRCFNKHTGVLPPSYSLSVSRWSFGWFVVALSTCCSVLAFLKPNLNAYALNSIGIYILYVMYTSLRW